MRFTREISIFTALNAAPTLLFVLIRYLTRAHHYGPHANGVPIPRRNFGDLLNLAPQFHFFHQFAFFHQATTFVYPAPLAVVYRVFFLFGSRTIAAFAATLLLVFATAAILFARALLRRGVAPIPAIGLPVLTLAFAWPVWFCLKQGNLEFLLFALLAVGIWAFLNGKNYLASVCFAVAGVMKIYPLIYLGLLLARKQYRAFFVGVATASVVLMVSLWLVCPALGESWNGMLSGLRFQNSSFTLAYQIAQSGLDHTLLSVAKLLLAAFGCFDLLHDSVRMNYLTTAYMGIAALVGVVLWIVRIRHLPLINQILCLSVAVTLFPPVSYDYTLLELYFSLALLFFVSLSPSAQLSLATRRALVVAIALFAFILSPESELIVHRARVGGQFKAAALLALFVLGLLHRFPSPASLPLQDAPASQDLVPS